MKEKKKDKYVVCIRCKEPKHLNVGNFKKRQAYLDFDPPFDVMCRDCRDKQSNDNRVKRVNSYKTKITCKECFKECENKRKGTLFCSEECSHDFRLRDQQRKRIESRRLNKADIKKPIDPKWTKRGKIHGVDY